MNRQEFLEEYEALVNRMHDILKRKNADYSAEADPFRNFLLVEHLGICTGAQGILTRMCDKMARISNLVDKEAQVKDESIQDTLMDLANYALILAIFLRRKS